MYRGGRLLIQVDGSQKPGGPEGPLGPAGPGMPELPVSPRSPFLPSFPMPGGPGTPGVDTRHGCYYLNTPYCIFCMFFLILKTFA